MRLVFTSLTLIALAGCSIQNNRPDYEYPEASKVKGTDWPDLGITSELQAEGAVVLDRAQTNQTEADRLAARARALRARADRLRRQVGN